MRDSWVPKPAQKVYSATCVKCARELGVNDECNNCKHSAVDNFLEKI